MDLGGAHRSKSAEFAQVAISLRNIPAIVSSRRMPTRDERSSFELVAESPAAIAVRATGNSPFYDGVVAEHR